MTFTNWPIVVKPGSILEDSSPWTIVTSRMKSWHDMAAPVLDDAELYVECRRWLTGDPPPWDGAPTLRNGTLVVDIIDKSGFREGTSLAGSLITGLARTVADTIGDDVEDSYDLITGEPTPPEGYRIPNQLRTLVAHPHVVYRDGEVTGIQQSSFTRKAAGPCRISTGGKSAPFVNEMIKAAVNYGGDVLGDNILIPGPGSPSGPWEWRSTPSSTACTKTLLSYNSTYLRSAPPNRAGRACKRPSSRHQPGLCPPAVMALRARRRETDPETAFDLSIVDAGPFLIGDQGPGALVPRRPYRRHQQIPGHPRVRAPLSPPRDRMGRHPASWKAQMGDLRSKKDPLSRGLGMLAETMSWLQRRSRNPVTEPIVGAELGPLADEPEEVRVGVEKVRDALLMTFYSGTGSPYLPADPAAVELWARQLYGFGMRQHDDVAKEMPIVLGMAARQRRAAVRGGHPADRPRRRDDPGRCGHRRCRTTLARHGQTQAPRQEDRGEEGSGREACTSATGHGVRL